MQKRYAISRSINGISLNGQEFMLDKNDEILKFKTAQKAITHFCGITQIQPDKLEDCGVNVCKFDDNGNYKII